jgi:hypothetical protein
MLVKILKILIYFLGSKYCQPNWIRNETSCYLPMQNQSSFSDAEIDCLNRNATLATIHSQHEFELLKNIKINYLPSSYYTWVCFFNLN